MIIHQEPISKDTLGVSPREFTISVFTDTDSLSPLWSHCSSEDLSEILKDPHYAAWLLKEHSSYHQQRRSGRVCLRSYQMWCAPCIPSSELGNIVHTTNLTWEVLRQGGPQSLCWQCHWFPIRMAMSVEMLMYRSSVMVSSWSKRFDKSTQVSFIWQRQVLHSCCQDHPIQTWWVLVTLQLAIQAQVLHLSGTCNQEWNTINLTSICFFLLKSFSSRFFWIYLEIVSHLLCMCI